MSQLPDRIETASVAQMVEDHVDHQISDVEKWDNRQLFDASGVFDLHTLAARIYAEGYTAGGNAERTRLGAAVRRERERQRATDQKAKQ